MAENKISAEEALTFIGINTESMASIDDFKAEFGKKFFTKESIIGDKDLMTQLFSKKIGEIQTEVKRRAQEDLGLKFERGELDKPIGELIPMVFEKAKTTYAEQLEEAKKLGGGGDAAVKAVQEQLDKTKRSFTDLETLHKSTVDKLTSDIAQRDEALKTTKLSFEIGNVFKEIKLKPLTSIEEKGFHALISSELKFDYDENGKLIVTDKAGAKIPNKDKAGTFFEPVDAVKSIAVREKLWATTPAGGRQLNGGKKPDQVNPDRKPVNQVSDAYLRNTGQL